MICHFYSRQFVAFLVAGGLAATANYFSRFVFSNWFSFSTSVILAYLVGMIAAFTLTKLFVFKGGGNSLSRSAVYFTVINMAAILQTWLISMGLAYYFLPRLGITDFVQEIAHAVGIAVPAFTSYLGHKFWTFS